MRHSDYIAFERGKKQKCMKRHFFTDFGTETRMFKKGGTNIRQMTKRGQKMSFHAGMVAIAAETGIL